MSIAPEWLLASALIGALVALWILRVVGAWSRSRRARRRGRAAVRGEERAESILEKHGFRVLDRQVALSYRLALGGEICDIDLRLDYLVERDGQEWVAEVKTGSDAPQIATAATRRQLLEYAHAFGSPRVLLVDAERECVVEVDFDRALNL